MRQKNPEMKVVHFDQREMALLIGEALIDRPRPPGMTSEQILDRLDPEVLVRCLRAAEAVYMYMLNQLNSDGIVAESHKITRNVH